MNYAVLAPVAAAAVALFAAYQARRLSVAPGWGDQGWFAVAAVASAGFAFTAMLSNTGVPAEVQRAAARLQMAFMVLEVWAWLRYVRAWLRLEARWPERLLWSLLPALALLALVPGVVLGDRLREYALAPWFFQRAVEPTLFGDALIAGCLGLALLGLVRMARAWRAGVPRAGAHVLAVGLLLLLGVNDFLVLQGSLATPFLSDVGFVLPVVVVAATLTSRFAADARELAGLRGRLEALVQERTQALARTQDALYRAERLAALGQFASGVAHEVNNPASVVSANLRWLRGAISEADGAEVREAADEAVEAMARITGLVRRLVDAGRLATTPRTGGATEVGAGLAGAVAGEQARFGERVRFEARGGHGLRAGVPAEAFQDMLAALLANAGEAIPGERAGRVEAWAETAPGGMLRILVRDDGRGLDPQVAARAFEPFFTTKPPGTGSGLGLSVARALAETHGGSLTLAAAQGGGAEARLELPRVDEAGALSLTPPPLGPLS